MRPNEQLKRSMLDCRVGHEEPTQVVVMVGAAGGDETHVSGPLRAPAVERAFYATALGQRHSPRQAHHDLFEGKGDLHLGELALLHDMLLPAWGVHHAGSLCN